MPESPKLQDRMVLNHFICREFGRQDGMEDLLRQLKEVGAQGDDEYFSHRGGLGESAYVKALRLSPHARVGNERLLEYDANIRAHSRKLRIGEGYERLWKPYQYLALLFSEHYLARYFEDAERLREDLNDMRTGVYRRIPEYTPDDLRTLAFQSATGSGKTLLMHAHILQFQHYLKRSGGRLNNIILLTPNEQMSLQHQRELEESGQRAQLFSDNAHPELQQHVKIIDLNKLGDKKGIKRVAVGGFGDNNLVLVDEGHLGASGRIWRKRRKELARGGFTFEYSATFNQVVSKGADKGEMINAYGKCVLFDYSYRRFHHEGYGKDYAISNLREDMEEQNSKMYLLGCLLTFYQQCRIWQDKGAEWRDFNIAKPLWVFLGKTVIGSSKADKTTTSDVVRILDFLGWMMADADRVQPMLEALLEGNSGLRGEDGEDYFHDRFDYLTRIKTKNIYDDICQALFGGRGRLRVIYLTSGDGEMHLRCADSPAFGVVNVGDSAKLYKLLTEMDNPDLNLEREAGFVKRLFAHVDRPDSTVNIVIGARRFIAGWNSWRVSTMGLMHVGVGEGPEIIQMFGRGVRLRGWKGRLKRHPKSGAELPEGGEDLSQLETLHIFGLRADYMQTFKKLLEEEGIDTEHETISLPVVTWDFAKRKDLKMIRVKGDAKYQYSDERPVLRGPESNGEPIVLDRYSSLQNVASGMVSDEKMAYKNSVKLRAGYVDFFNKTRIYEKLLECKRRKGWHNMSIEREAVDKFLQATDWYDLYLPPERYEGMSDFQGILDLEDIALELITRYAERFWRRQRGKWERERFEVVPLDKKDPNIIKKYELSVGAKEETLIKDINELKELLDYRKETVGIRSIGIRAIMSDNHVYKPLLYALKRCAITIQPVALDEGEARTVDNLLYLIEKKDDCLQDWELYLLRNMSRGRGVSFFDDYHYYPDFIAWLKKGARQHVVFLDPKGLGRFGDKEKRKVALHHTIKDIEKKIREQDADISLHAYILSVTQREQIDTNRSAEEWRQDGVYFLQEEDSMRDVIRDILAN